MLQRAASNAYSWWWASHIRTKQSKWLEQNLQDMEEKVRDTLKLIEEDGDSFAKRAEMYYKKRPELIHFVEESYRAYRALAERYDHLSKELQNANTTIASVFPEQVPFSVDDEDDDGSPKIQKKPQEVNKTNIPQVPSAPTKNLKGLLTSSVNKLKPKKAPKNISAAPAVNSGISKSEALSEIESLQKRILALQTEKEFVKVSYESSVIKYWEIETRITEMQEKICSLQDEFGASAVMDDDEARSLMTAAALRSCQDTLAQLQDKQEKSANEARVEQQRIEEVRKKLQYLRADFPLNEINQDNRDNLDKPVEADEIPNSLDQDALARELKSLREKIKEQLAGCNTCLTVTEMAEKVDELVSKVIDLEGSVSSQIALIGRLRAETNELQSKIQSMENDRATSVDEEINMSSELRDMEVKLKGIQDLNRNVEDQNNSLQTHFTEAHCNLDLLTDKLQSMKPDNNVEVNDSLQRGSESQIGQDVRDGCHQEHNEASERELRVTDSPEQEKQLLEIASEKKEFEEQDSQDSVNDLERIKNVKTENKEEKKEQDLGAITNSEEEARIKHFQAPNEHSPFQSELNNHEPLEDEKKIDVPDTVDDSLHVKAEEHGTGQDDEPDWQQLYLNGLDDREKVLLAEYTSVLRNFKEAKKKLSEIEKKNEDRLSETTIQLRQLSSANAMKDEEIQSLRQKLSLLQTNSHKNMISTESVAANYQQPTFNLLDDQPAQLKARNEEPAVWTQESHAKCTLAEEEDEDDIKVIPIDKPYIVSATEENFRMKIDEVLEQNLNFWLRYSTSFHQIQKYQTGIDDLNAETYKLLGKLEENHETRDALTPTLRSDVRPIHKHLREIQNELTLWVEQSGLLKDELQCRFSSLCNIQEQISKASEDSSESEGSKLSRYQAAKFQGEVMNMQQENNKVADELQAGLDHITVLQLEVDNILAKLNEEFELSGSKNQYSTQLKHSTSRTRVPLRSFIFGAKSKKQKPSLFSCVHPALNRKYHGLRAGLPLSSRTSSRKKDP